MTVAIIFTKIVDTFESPKVYQQIQICIMYKCSKKVITTSIIIVRFFCHCFVTSFPFTSFYPKMFENQGDNTIVQFTPHPSSQYIILIEMSIANQGKFSFENYIFSFYLYFTYNTKLILFSYTTYKLDSK